ncbi:MAG: restriction endonuclease [Candidatus Paceibacterota bacterium]
MQIIDYSVLYKSFLHGFFALWPIWVGLGLLLLLKILLEVIVPDKIAEWKRKRNIKNGQEWRSDRELLQQLRGMKSNEFEKYIADLFFQLGYKTNAVGRSHDGGIDVTAEKNGIINYIQCKKFITSQVPVGAVRDFYGALADHVANGKGYFITTNKFTLEAEKFAEDKPIELVDSFKLIEYVRIAQNVKKVDTVKANNIKQVCPKCGNELLEKEGKFGKFLGCSAFPKCRFTS